MGKVDPVDLHYAGHRFLTVSEDASREFVGHHDALADAATGLLERSRAALSARTTAWRDTTAAFVARVDAHARMLHENATTLAAADAAAADHLETATGQAPWSTSRRDGRW